jgi:hypothetical protein
MLMMDFLMIEGVHLIKIYMTEIFIHHHPLLARCGLSLEEILMKNLQLPKITEGMPLISAIDKNTMLLRMTVNLVFAIIFMLIGTKGLEVEIEGSSVLNLKTATKAERTALKEIINTAVTAVIQIMRGAGKRVAGEGMILLSMNMKERG